MNTFILEAKGLVTSIANRLVVPNSFHRTKLACLISDSVALWKQPSWSRLGFASPCENHPSDEWQGNNQEATGEMEKAQNHRKKEAVRSLHCMLSGTACSQKNKQQHNTDIKPHLKFNEDSNHGRQMWARYVLEKTIKSSSNSLQVTPKYKK